MKRDSVLFGYVFPLTGQGFGAFVKTLICLCVPLVSVGAPAFSFRSRARGASALRMIWLLLRLFLPGIALFLLCNEALCRGLGLALGYALMALMALSLISSFVRMPMALAALAAGESMRSALSRGYVKRLIEASFGRYLLLLAGTLPFAAGMALCGRLTALPGAACAAALTAWLWVYLGFGAGVCYERATGLPPNRPEKRAGKGRAKRAASAMLIAALLCPLCLPGTAALAESMDGAEFARRIKETFSLENGRVPILSTAWDSISNGFSRAASGVKSGYDAAMKRLGFWADVTPVISNVNDLAEAHAYNQQWVNPALSDAQREKARNLMILKGIEGLLPSRGALKWLGHVMTGADIAADQFYGGWEKLYDEWFGGARNAGERSEPALLSANLQGVYQGNLVYKKGSEGAETRLTGYFYVTGSGRTLTVTTCNENGDYLECPRASVVYNDESGAYYGKKELVEGGEAGVYEYTVRFATDERGVRLSVQCEQIIAAGIAYASSLTFTDGRWVGAGSGREFR